MSRQAVFASVLAALAAILVAGPAAAAGPAAPTPPPGAANVQTAGVSSDGQGNPAAYHCGADASTGSSGTVAVPPTQIGPSGASTPSGCTSPSSSAGAQTAPAGAGASTAAKTSTANAASTGTARAAGGENAPLTLSRTASGQSGGPLWWGLLLLLAILFALIGFAVGRRRPARASA